jgi:hypothetical protein
VICLIKIKTKARQILDIARAGGAYNDGSSNWSNSNSNNNIDLGFIYNTLFKNNMLNFQR